MAAVHYTSTNHSLDDNARRINLTCEFSNCFAWIFVDMWVYVRPNAAAIWWQVCHGYKGHNALHSIHK